VTRVVRINSDFGSMVERKAASHQEPQRAQPPDQQAKQAWTLLTLPMRSARSVQRPPFQDQSLTAESFGESLGNRELMLPTQTLVLQEAIVAYSQPAERRQRSCPRCSRAKNTLPAFEHFMHEPPGRSAAAPAAPSPTASYERLACQQKAKSHGRLFAMDSQSKTVSTGFLANGSISILVANNLVLSPRSCDPPPGPTRTAASFKATPSTNLNAMILIW